ncbi:MAG TPA: rod shape-determining protein, partial [Bacillota bacterium]|nr:rod shape-determining protein [Bacillota bacterium]
YNEPFYRRTIKLNIGYATAPPADKALLVKGRNLATGLPVRIEIKAEEVHEALEESLNVICDTVQATIEKAPPELASDIMDRGMILVGGGAQIRNLDTLLRKNISIPVMVAEDPATCVVRGTGLALEEMTIMRQVARSQRSINHLG